MSRPTLVALKWIFLFASVALLVLSVVEVWRTAERVMWGMHQLGWSNSLRRSPSFPLGWVLACQWDRRCSEVFNGAWWKLYPKWVPSAFIVCLYGAGIARILAERAREKLKVLPGAARWAGRKELGHLIYGERGSPQRGYVGLVAPERGGVFGSDPVVLRLPERIRCAHCMVVGGPGARKTTGYHKMNLLGDAVDGVSAVVFDLKYPDPMSGLLDCVPIFAKKGFDVQLFLPFEEETLALPLIAGVSTVEEAYDVVDVLRPESPREHSGTWFLRQERELLGALVLGVATDHLRDDGDPYRGKASLRRLYLLCKGGVREVERYIHTHPNPEVRRMAAGLFDLREDTLAGTIAGIAGALHIFNDEVLDRNTSSREDAGEEVDLKVIGERPCLLYVGIPQEKVVGARGQVLVQLVKRVVERELLRTADRHGGVCPQHVSIYIDEFRAMGPLPNVSEMMATMRSRRVCYHLSLQNRAQGEELYGPVGFRSFFVNNVQTVIIFPRYLKFDDAQYFSEVLGYMTTEQRSTGYTHRMFEMLGGSRTEWYRDVLRPLVPPEEYSDWPDGMGILFTTGVRPVKVLLPRLDEDRIMNVRNPFAGLRDEYVAPFTAVLRTREGRQRVISWLMAHHRAVSGVHGASRTRELKTARSGGVDGEGRASPASTAATAQERRPEAHRGSAASPLPHAAGTAAGEAEGQLKRWAEAVAGLSLPSGAVRAYFHNRRMTKLSIHRAVLPQELSAPPGLLDWMARGWVRVTPSEIALLPKGFQVVGRELLGTVRRKATGESRQGEGSGASARPAPRAGRAATVDAGVSAPPEPGRSPEESLEGRALRAVVEWVKRNSALLEGHPTRVDGGEPVGVWKEGEFVALLPSVVASILEGTGVSPEQQHEVRKKWKDAGCIVTDAEHVTVPLRLAGRVRRVFVFSWKLFADYQASV